MEKPLIFPDTALYDETLDPYSMIKSFSPRKIKSLFSEHAHLGAAKLSDDTLFKISDELYLGWKDTGVGRFSEIIVLCNIKDGSTIIVRPNEFGALRGRLEAAAYGKVIDKEHGENRTCVAIDADGMVSISGFNHNDEVTLAFTITKPLASKIAYSMFFLPDIINAKLRPIKQRIVSKAHKNASMIVAKTMRMELVVFCCRRSTTDWYSGSLVDLVQDSAERILLSHPKHTKVCSYWLSGGTIEVKTKDGWMELLDSQDLSHYNIFVPSDESCHNNLFVREDVELRVKPYDASLVSTFNFPESNDLLKTY